MNDKDAKGSEVCFPSFETLEEGFSCIKMEPKADEFVQEKGAKRRGFNENWESTDQVFAEVN